MRLIYPALFPAAWAAWGLYWYISSLRVKPAARTESVASRLSHYVPLVLAVLLLASPAAGRTVLGRAFLPQSAVMFWLGALLLLAGLSFSVAARHVLGGNWSSTVTVKRDHSLTRSGPYGWCGIRSTAGCCWRSPATWWRAANGATCWRWRW